METNKQLVLREVGGSKNTRISSVADGDARVRRDQVEGPQLGEHATGSSSPVRCRVPLDEYRCTHSK